MTEPLVSIVITSYNYEDYIRECIDSCQKQTYKNCEIVLIDDCSTDDTLDKIDFYADIDCISVMDENMGYSYAKNYGIGASMGELIAHLDADDMLTENSIEVRVKEFLKDPSLDMVHGLAYRYRDGKIDGYNKNSKIHAQGVMIRKSVYERFGYYDEEMRSKSDKLMWYKLGVHPRSPLKPKIKSKKINKFVALYRKHDKQMHKIRRDIPELNKKINDLFEKKVKEYVRQGK